MSTSFGYFIFIFLVFQQVVDCNYINCYSCNACGSTSNTWTQVLNSSSGIVYCFKYSYSFSVISYTNRGASSTCTAGSDGLGGTYYCCLTDYCNRSVSLSHSFGFIFALITVVCIFKRVSNY